jgi:hypothetical protein
MTTRTETLCTSCNTVTKRGEPCSDCGADPESLESICLSCDGTGRVQYVRGARVSDLHPDDCVTWEHACPDCFGTGKVEPEFVLGAERWAVAWVPPLQEVEPACFAELRAMGERMFPGRPACACCGNPFSFREQFGEWICAACDLMRVGEPFICPDWSSSMPLVPAGLPGGAA